MADKKSILEEALLDIKNIQSALNANTKEILRSVAKEEINGVVKESLIDEVYEEEELELEPAEMGGKEEGSEEDGLGDIESSEEEPEMGSELGMDTDVLGGAEMDMTAASDDDVIAIYKKLSGEDEIEIVGDEIHLNISEPGEYIVKTGGEEAEEEELELEPAEMGGEEEESDDVEYEIEMGDDEEEESEIPTDLVPADGEEDEEEVEDDDEVEALEEKISIGTGMSVGTHRNKTGAGSIGAQENPKSMNESAKAKQLVSETTKKYNTLLTEARKLKTENEEFRSALREFRTKLVETVVFNSNLTYVTKLFLEHSTTKAEKDAIIKRFDEAANLKESKKLYKTIGGELESRKPINESVESKIIKEATTSTSKQLNESTAYVDPSTKRIMDLISRVEKR
jgi:hypothetical protein